MKDRFLSRLGWLVLAAAVLIALVRWVPAPEQPAPGPEPSAKTAAPRLVAARGDLAGDERSTIELFERSRDSVVYISTRAQVRDFWTRNVLSVPRGTGSGFIWDENGHVVTNYHVIQGASEATVRLADGRDYKAALVGASPAHDIAVLRIGVGFRRPPLGIEVDEDLNRRLAVALNVQGVVILRVAQGSAAAAAGLQGVSIGRDGSVTAGDIIVALEGKPVESVGKLLGRLDDHKGRRHREAHRAARRRPTRSRGGPAIGNVTMKPRTRFDMVEEFGGTKRRSAS